MADNGKPKVALFDFACCEGCQLTVVDALQPLAQGEATAAEIHPQVKGHIVEKVDAQLDLGLDLPVVHRDRRAAVTGFPPHADLPPPHH